MLDPYGAAAWHYDEDQDDDENYCDLCDGFCRCDTDYDHWKDEG